MTKKIINLIEKHIPKEKQWILNTWYSHTTQNKHISSVSNNDFPLIWGDKGIIPKSLTFTINNLVKKDPKSLTTKIVETVHNHIAAKWKLKFYALYNKNLSITEICSKENIKKFLKSR